MCALKEWENIEERDEDVIFLIMRMASNCSGVIKCQDLILCMSVRLGRAVWDKIYDDAQQNHVGKYN